jgi:hypothetical protein
MKATLYFDLLQVFGSQVMDALGGILDSLGI